MNGLTLTQEELESRLFIQKVYAWMCAGLAVTAGVAMYMASDERLIRSLIFSRYLLPCLFAAHILLVFSLALLVERMSVGVAGFIFLFYSALNGVLTSVIFLVYTGSSIAKVFLLTAGMFGFMSAYGWSTKRDLTNLDSHLSMGLLGIILASVVNWWLNSPLLDWITSCAGVLIFTLLAANDTYKIKKANKLGNSGTDEDTKEAIHGALILYLDFLNLFMYLMDLLGKRRDD